MSDEKDPSLEAAYNLSTPDDSKALYRDWAGTYDQDFAERSGYRFPALIAEAYLAAGGAWPALDVGCGTGLIARHLPKEAVLDGIDISPEMLAQASAKDRYRTLIEADLTQPLALETASYAGMLSSGTFTHGHVGPEALHELIRLLRPNAICAVAGNREFYRKAGFAEVFSKLAEDGAITPVEIREERIYEEGASPPEGHEDDIGLVVTFRRL